jgi:hypothetical protein
MRIGGSDSQSLSAGQRDTRWLEMRKIHAGALTVTPMRSGRGSPLAGRAGADRVRGRHADGGSVLGLVAPSSASTERRWAPAAAASRSSARDVLGAQSEAAMTAATTGHADCGHWAPRVPCALAIA